MSDEEVVEAEVVDEEVVDELDDLPPIDPDHPWVVASQFVRPQPTDVIVKFDEVELDLGTHKLPCALMTTVTESAVSTVFLTPPQLAQLLRQGAEVLETFRPAKSGLVVADTEDMKQAARADKAARKLKKA